VRIGRNIRARRMELGLSQTTLGAECRPPITFQQVQKYEKGTNRVSGSRIEQIARALATTVAALHGEEGAEAPTSGFDRADFDIAREAAPLPPHQKASVLRIIRELASVAAA
jgi:transcriptional regulator with XRE-family HTH domain